MLDQNFIFSDKRSDRIQRHFWFWFIWALYLGTVHAASPMFIPKSSYFSNLPFSIARNFLLLVPQIFATYTILYIVVPLYAQKRNLFLSVLCLIPIWAICAGLNVLMAKSVNPIVLKWLLPAEFYRSMTPPPGMSPLVSLLAITKGVFTSASIMVLIRYGKQWYLKEQRNLQLLKEKSESQLLLLTSQVHPQFLFNTLNNIYNQTKYESPKGSKMILRLSDILHYILNEGNKRLVPLQKEIQLIQDYINLEKIRYGNKLTLIQSYPQPGNLQIAPLLLLPFVENCFKHGASKFLSSPWIKLTIEIQGCNFNMTLINGKDPYHRDTLPESGIGITNVKKRLALQYPGTHELTISDKRESFEVQLYLQLVDLKSIPEAKEKVTALMQKEKSYAEH